MAPVCSKTCKASVPPLRGALLSHLLPVKTTAEGSQEGQLQAGEARFLQSSPKAEQSTSR